MKSRTKQILFSIIWITLFRWVASFASEIFIEPSTWTVKMYCPQTVSVKINNSDSPISSIDMILTYDSSDIQDENFSINTSEYNSPIFNEYTYNSSIGSDTRKFGWTRLVDWIENATTKHLWNFSFRNTSWITIVDLDFHAISGVTAWDTNLAYQWDDKLFVPWWVAGAQFHYIVGTCTSDTQEPQFPNGNLSIANGANRVVANQTFDFRIIDQSTTYVDYRYPTDDLSLSNYLPAPAWVDNQYGVDSGTIELTIQWETYTDNFKLNSINLFDSIASTWTTRHREDKWYDIHITPLHQFEVEEEIILTMSWYDNTHISKSTRYLWQKTIIFNQPQVPYLIRDNTVTDRSPESSTVVDPDLWRIVFRVADARAWVDSGTLTVEIRTWTISNPNWWILKSYTNEELSMESVNMTFPSNGVTASNAINHSQNYDITLTGYDSLPEDAYIRVIVDGQDLAQSPNIFQSPSNRFVFQTRVDCNTLQCFDGIRIYTWWSLSTPFLHYTDPDLYITGWYNPYISWQYLYCSTIKYGPLDIFKNPIEISYWFSTGWTLLLEQFTRSELIINAVWWTIELIGNTLYFTETPAFCGDGNLGSGEECDDGNTNNWDGCSASCNRESSGWGGGWGGVQQDDCLLPDSNLPGANREGIDYSSSYYDRTCLWEGEIYYDEPDCSIGPEYDDYLVKAYQYACELGITTMPDIEQANLDGIVLRRDLAKMISEYAMKIMVKEADINRDCRYTDMEYASQEMNDYAILACQLGLMWLQSDGTPARIFNPNGVVPRAEFATAFSRLIYGNIYNTEDTNLRYQKHIEALYRDNILDSVSNPFEAEKRWIIMDMMKRSDKSNFGALHEYLSFNEDQNICSVSPYGEELEWAYMYACMLGITDAPTIQEADMYGELSRITLAQMVSVYSIKVLWNQPNKSRICVYQDLLGTTDTEKYWIKTSCELWLMWLEYDGSPANFFWPDDKVNRAMFITVFSRLLFGETYNGNADCRYCPHANALHDYGIVKDIDNPEERIELIWYAMLMIERSKDIIREVLMGREGK